MSELSEELREKVFGQSLSDGAVAKTTRILVAADRLLRTNPSATLEDIGVEAGVSRTTVYRRFPTRQLLILTLSRWAVGRIAEALERASIEVAPAYVALYQATRNVIEVKVSLDYTRGLALPDDPIVSEYQEQMTHTAIRLVRQCQSEGIISNDVDPGWVRVLFYAIIHAATGFDSLDAETVDEDTLARRIVDSFLHGVGTGRTL